MNAFFMPGGALTDADKNALRNAGPGAVIPISAGEFARIYSGAFNANAYRALQQRKLDAAKAFLKERAAFHPEWKVSKA